MSDPTAPAPRIVDLVFGTQPREWRWRGLVAIAVALLGHGVLGLWARRSERSLESWSAQVAARIHAELSKEVVVELEKPPPPPPPVAKAEPPPPKAPPPQARPSAPAPMPAESARPPPPAQAGQVVAMAPSPDAPVDLTGNAFVTGNAQTYAGGVTASSGTSTKAVQAQEVAPGPPAPDRSTQVALEDPDWSCPWPHEADAEQIDEQVAVVRVMVRPDGTAETASVVKDPGHGFGEAALACAMRTAFTPARDRDGRAIRAQSPPIRVRFTR